MLKLILVATFIEMEKCQDVTVTLLFFAAYVICKKNYSFSRVVFLLFRPKLPALFIQKTMTAVGLGQQGSQAVG